MGSNLVIGGGFADIWRGKYGDKFVALKVLRIFVRGSDSIKLRKVTEPTEVSLDDLGILTYEC